MDTNDFTGQARDFARTYNQRTRWCTTAARSTQRWGYGSGLPVTYVIDRKGVVRHLFDGEITGPTLDAVLNKLLAGQSSETTRARRRLRAGRSLAFPSAALACNGWSQPSMQIPAHVHRLP